MLKTSNITWSLLFFSIILISQQGIAQDSTQVNSKVVKQEELSIIVKPSSITRKDRCGVLFILPFTGGISSKFMRVYFNDWNADARWQADYDLFLKRLVTARPMILVMVTGSTSAKDHDTKGFADAISRFDSQIKKDLAMVEKNFTIDRSELYLTGFSLGGDLSWAISQKNPGMFKGAVIAGSRCGYRANNGFNTLKKNDFKVYLASGQLESSVIVSGIEQAKIDLSNLGIEHMYYEIPGVRHQMLPADKFLEALRFVMGLE